MKFHSLPLHWGESRVDISELGHTKLKLLNVLCEFMELKANKYPQIPLVSPLHSNFPFTYRPHKVVDVDKEITSSNSRIKFRFWIFKSRCKEGKRSANITASGSCGRKAHKKNSNS